MMLAHLEIFSRVIFANVLQPRFLVDYLNEFTLEQQIQCLTLVVLYIPGNCYLLPMCYLPITAFSYCTNFKQTVSHKNQLSFFNIGWLFDFRDFYRLAFRFPTLMPTESQRQKHTEGCLRLKKASE